MDKSPATDADWEAFRDTSPDSPAEYAGVIRFSEGAMSDTLADLVVNGPKRATCALLRDWETGIEPVFPEPGMFWVIVDGADRPRAVVRTTAVDIRPFGEVDAAFAWEEGEGDRTLPDWREAHMAYFSRQAAAEGFVFDDATPVVLERFVLVWAM